MVLTKPFCAPSSDYHGRPLRPGITLRRPNTHITHPVLRNAALLLSAKGANKSPVRPLALSPLDRSGFSGGATGQFRGGSEDTLPPTMGNASGYVPKLVSPPARPGGMGGSAMVQMDPFGFTESCMMKPLMTVPLGFVMGAAFGVFMGSWEGISPPIMLPGVPLPPQKPMVEEFRATGRQMGRKARNWSRNFAVITAIFSGTECGLERIRAQDDMWNSISAGFISGAVLAIRQGPQAMLLGGAGFAAFSYVIDKLTGRH